MTACLMNVNLAGDPCGFPVVAVVVAGCVHEHIGPVEVCGWHRDMAAAGRLDCTVCAEAGHVCVRQLLTEEVTSG